VVQSSLTGIGMTSMRTRQRLITRLMEQGISNLHVLDIIRATPRHLFLDEALAHRAYEDTALPIGHNQTLSQPYIVARMTELLLNGRPSLKRVLEVGTGSGYQTSILAPLCERLFSVERIRPLQDKAKLRLRDLGFRNVYFKHADGGFGWPEKGPYDAILSAAAPEVMPQELLQQLAVGGRLVIPIGGAKQQLVVVDRLEDGFVENIIEPVNFVPLLKGVIV
jgi:protein-L-isoaspartate(D-aspartate) O-methyltransferase